MIEVVSFCFLTLESNEKEVKENSKMKQDVRQLKQKMEGQFYGAN